MYPIFRFLNTPLISVSTKNYCNRAIHVQVPVKDAVTCFLTHSVQFCLVNLFCTLKLVLIRRISTCEWNRINCLSVVEQEQQRSCRTRKRAFHFHSPGVVRRSNAAGRPVRALLYGPPPLPLVLPNIGNLTIKN